MQPGDIKSKKAIAKENADIHAEAIVRFNDVMERERESRDLGIEDTRFAQIQNGMYENYGDAESTDGSTDNSPDIPEYSFNLVAGAIDTVIGDQRQNEINVRVRPDGDGAEKKDAEIFNGLIKNIQNQSGFQAVNDNAFDETLNSGYGGYRVITQYTNDDVNLNSFDQEILIEPINSAVSSLYFGPSKKYDKSDALYAFLIWNESIPSYEAMYPDATVSDFSDERFAADAYQHWFNGDDVRLAEYWRKIPIKRKIALLSDRRVIDLEDEKEAIKSLAEQGITIIRTRSIDDWQIERYIINGAEVLKPVEKWAGKYIPLIPQYGKITHIAGRTWVRGLVRFAKDANRVYNFLRSAIVAQAAKSPKDPYWMTPAMVKGHAKKLSRMNIDDDPIQLYNPDPEHAGGLPARTGAPAVQQALIEAAQTARMDVQAGMGVSAGTAQPTAGTDLDMRSGKAIEAQARRGDSGAYTFMSNQALSIEYLGQVLVDLIPRIYDGYRQVRIMKTDGETEEITINETVQGQDGMPVIVNDLSKGRYSTVVDIGPAFATQRMEAADRLIAISADPTGVFARLTPDLLAKNLDLPGDASNELHERLRKQMIQEGIVEPTEEEAQELQPSESQLAKADRESRREEAEIKIIEANAMQLMGAAEKSIADIENKDYDSNKKAVEALETLMDTIKKKVEAGMPVTVQDMDLMVGQMDLIEISAQSLDPGPNSNQLDDPAETMALAPTVTL